MKTAIPALLLLSLSTPALAHAEVVPHVHGETSLPLIAGLIALGLFGLWRRRGNR